MGVEHISNFLTTHYISEKIKIDNKKKINYLRFSILAINAQGIENK